MKKKPRLAIALLLSSAALFAAGCSASTTTTPTATSTSPAAGTAPTLGAGVDEILAGVKPDDTLAAKLPAKYKDGFKYGSDLTAPPGTFLAEDGTTAIGFEIDLINAIAKRLGTQGTVSNADFSTLITSVKTGRIDLTISQMNDNKTRQQEIDFIDYYDAGIAFIVKKGNPESIQGPADLCDKAVSAGPGSSQLAWAEATSPKVCPADKPMKITPITQNQQRLNSLKTGRLAVVLNDTPGSAYIAATSGGGNDFELVDLKEPIEPAPYGMGFNKDNSAFRDAIQASLQSLMDDGTYLKILKAWHVQSGARTEATINGGK